jgi:methylenetetrahydrofolate reductase (NADPH)
MKISDIFKQKKLVLSFELFPPRRDGNLEALFATIEELKNLRPDFISVTYGAGGSSRDLTYDIAVRLKNTGILPLVHFTCVGQSRPEIRQLLQRLRSEDVENLLALRGDPPKGQAAFTPAEDGFRHADELVRFVRTEGFEFCLGVAGYPEKHPEAPSLQVDLQNLKRKIEAGAQFVVTQLFFDNEDYFRFVEGLRAVAVGVPVQPGIWLLTDPVQAEKISQLGAKVPASLKSRLQEAGGDKEKVVQIGIDYAARQCAELLSRGAPGIHFYVMNKSFSVKRVMEKLRDGGWNFGLGT